MAYIVNNLENVIVWVIAGLLGAGMFLILFHKVSFRDNALARGVKGKVSGSLKKMFATHSAENNLLRGTNFYLDKDLYGYIRVTIAVTIVITALLSKSVIGAIFGLALYVLSRPVEFTAKGKPTVWHKVLEKIKDVDRNRKDDEILESLALLKNIVVQQKDSPVGISYILENLAQNADYTKAAYLKMINLLNLGKKEMAVEAFCMEVDTQIGKELASLLIQFDNLNTGELEQAVMLKQNFVKEKKKTRNNQKNQIISALIFAVVFFGLMVELFNFVYVAFFSNADLFSIKI